MNEPEESQIIRPLRAILFVPVAPNALIDQTASQPVALTRSTRWGGTEGRGVPGLAHPPLNSFPRPPINKHPFHHSVFGFRIFLSLTEYAPNKRHLKFDCRIFGGTNYASPCSNLRQPNAHFFMTRFANVSLPPGTLDGREKERGFSSLALNAQFISTIPINTEQGNRRASRTLLSWIRPRVGRLTRRGSVESAER
jgi:hypothetical protein